MNYSNWGDINSKAVQQENRPSVYISNGLNFDEEDNHIWEFVQSSIKKLYVEDQYYDIIGNLIHGGMFFFDTEEEQYDFYSIFNQKITEKSPIYACTYAANGDCQTENT